MADKTTQSMNDILNYMLRGVPPSWGGNANLYLSLHVGAIGVGGNQTSNEVDYVGYARVPIARNASGSFSAANAGSCLNSAGFLFGLCTAQGGISLPCTITHIAIGENSIGAGTVIVTTALTSPIIVNVNSKPEVATSTLNVQEA